MHDKLSGWLKANTSLHLRIQLTHDGRKKMCHLGKRRSHTYAQERIASGVPVSTNAP